MKLLLDQNLSAGAAEILRREGMDVVHTREVGLATADDPDILQWCRDHGRVAITLDADFHAYLALADARSPSVIRIRIEGLGDVELAVLIRRVLDLVAEDLLRGVAVTVTPRSVRLRTLPLSAD
jgi:predicted nuclease of predicted toxin-antitoxin system